MQETPHVLILYSRDGHGDGTIKFMSIALNGPVTDEEWVGLVDFFSATGVMVSVWDKSPTLRNANRLRTTVPWDAAKEVGLRNA